MKVLDMMEARQVSIEALVGILERMHVEGLITSDLTAEEWSQIDQACLEAFRPTIKRGTDVRL